MLFIGSDHRGYKIKDDVKSFLKAQKIKFTDVGDKKFDKNDDYPDYSKKVAAAVSKDPSRNKGIILCGSGQGVCMVANKFKYVRAAVCWNEQIAKMSRSDDDSNILCLPADYISPEIAEHIITKWLNTPFSFDPRHIRRLKELAAIESKR